MYYTIEKDSGKLKPKETCLEIYGSRTWREQLKDKYQKEQLKDHSSVGDASGKT